MVKWTDPNGANLRGRSGHSCDLQSDTLLPLVVCAIFDKHWNYSGEGWPVADAWIEGPKDAIKILKLAPFTFDPFFQSYL